jgi:hypothetical protein
VVVGTQLTGISTVVLGAPGIATVSLVGHVRDTNPLDSPGTLVATIDWRDGTTSPASVRATAQPGMFDLVGSHAYGQTGGFVLFINVTSLTTGATIGFPSQAFIAPGPAVTPTISYMTAGVERSVLLGHIIDGNPNHNFRSYFVSIDWLDGVSHLADVNPSATPGVFDITSRHTYADARIHGAALRVVVIDSQQEFNVIDEIRVVDDPATIPKLGQASGTHIDAVLKAPPPPPVIPGFVVASFVNEDPEEAPVNLAITIDWGDGTTSSSSGGGILIAPVGANTGASDVISPHTYFTAGTFTVKTTVTDRGTGATTDATSTAIVPDTLYPTGTVQEVVQGVAPAQPGLLMASFIDQSPFEVQYSVTIDWGDGTPPSSTGGGSSPVFVTPAGTGTFDVFSAHTYASTGQFIAKVTVTSPTIVGSETSTTVNVVQPLQASGTRVNAVPGVTPPAPGFLVASFFDANVFEQPSDFDITVDWGDGTPPSTSLGAGVSVSPVGGPLTGAFDVFAPHSYASGGTFPISVMIKSRVTGGTATAASTATTGAELLAAGTNIAATPTVAPAVPGFLVGSFVDANPSAPPTSFLVTVDWGDGTMPSSTPLGVFVAPVPSAPQGTFDVFSTHAYASAGTFPVTVTITSATGATVTTASIARVTSKLLASGAVLRASPAAPVPPGAGGFVVASVIDTGGVAPPASAFSSTIDWGDGTPQTTTGTFLGSPVIGTFDLVSTHTYATAGPFTATITINETVNGPPPLLSTTTTTTTTARFQVGP